MFNDNLESPDLKLFKIIINLEIKNVYIVLTEYQLLQAVNIATSVYNRSTFNNIIYVIRKGSRLGAIDAKKDHNHKNITFIFLDKQQPKEISKIIFAEKPNHLLLFQGTSPLNVFLGYVLSKKGVQISLGPDGYSAYSVYSKKYKLLTIIKDSFLQNVELFNMKLFSNKFHIFNYYTYGNHDFIDNIWITHPDSYTHRAKNKVKILSLPEFSTECISILKNLYTFSLEFPKRDVIYFFNQPFWPELLTLEYSFLNDVLNHFPKKEIVVKLHPLTSEMMKSKYKALDRVHLIECGLPAEILLLSLDNCIVYSGWSTVLITENKNCNYYFNYPIYKDSGNRNLSQVEIPPLSHIKMIKKATEMKFPSRNESKSI